MEDSSPAPRSSAGLSCLRLGARRVHDKQSARFRSLYHRRNSLWSVHRVAIDELRSCLDEESMPDLIDLAESKTPAIV